MNILLFTAAAALCFGIIWTFSRDRNLGAGHYKLLCITGVPAYVIGLSTVIYIGTEDILTGIIIILAWICFVIMSGVLFMRIRQFSSREYTIMVLWGQSVFPVVLLALPEVVKILT